MPVLAHCPVALLNLEMPIQKHYRPKSCNVAACAPWSSGQRKPTF
jgi:hypothetical protein